jgi:hypothetical protein
MHRLCPGYQRRQEGFASLVQTARNGVLLDLQLLGNLYLSQVVMVVEAQYGLLF